MGSPARTDQTEFLQRIESVVRWIKRNLDYRGSKQTGDFRGLVLERFCKRDTYRDAFEQDPARLNPMIGAVTRNVVIDEMRARGAQRRVPAHALQSLDGGTGTVAALTPSPDEVAEDRERDALVRRALAKLRANKSGTLRHPDKMVDAFERAFYQGESHRRIARELGEARTTVDNWIHVLVLRLAREVAEHER